MLDIKAFDDTDHRRITDEGNGIVLKNAVFLAKHGKLEEVRAVIVPDLYDGEKSIRGIGTLLAPYRNIREIRIKLIAYRPMGVREAYSHYQVPSPECLTQLADILREMGFKDICDHMKKEGIYMGKTSHMDESQVMVQMKDIVKKFGNFTANDHINLTVHKGEVHAILGENGAGKSTMMNVLCGLYKPTSGQIFIKGKEVHFSSPKDAIDIGIGMVHQHFMLIQPFTVTDNIILGIEPVKELSIDKAAARQKVMELSERYGMKVDPDAKIEDISVGMQQRVEILKVLYRGADTLILDEPTASLTPQEIEGLMEIIENLTRDGKSVILITHKLKEITASSDHCTIIRQGKYIRTVNVDEVTENDLAAMMVGRDVNFKVDKKEQEPGGNRSGGKGCKGKGLSGRRDLKGT